MIESKGTLLLSNLNFIYKRYKSIFTLPSYLKNNCELFLFIISGINYLENKSDNLLQQFKL